jgi:hypothetical protein
MRPADLLAATEFVVARLRPETDREWSMEAGDLEWDVAFTVTHVAAHLTKAATYLASAATTWSPLVVSADPRATNDQLLDAVEIAARALAFVADHADDVARGFHAWGMGDASAFLARAANEVLVHGWDVARGLGVAFDPPAAVCAPVVLRRFPWLEDDLDPWPTLLTSAGRRDEPAWIPIEIALDEWDGAVPDGAGRPPAISWQWRGDTAGWVPTYP